MFQGNFGLIKNRETGETRWVWKLHVKESKKLYFDPADPSFALEQVDVDEGTHAIDRPWRVIHEIPAEEARQYVQFTPPETVKADTVSAYELRKSIIDMESMIGYYQTQIDTAKSKLENAEAEYKACKTYLDKLRYEFNDVVRESKEPLFCYVYGIHNLNNRTEYCWYADGKVAENVKSGDIVSVETVQGNVLAFVTRVERSNEYIPHKRVLKIERTKENAPDLPF